MDTNAESSPDATPNPATADPDELLEEDLEAVSGGIIIDGWPMNTTNPQD
jgi:hypothetical protein